MEQGTGSTSLQTILIQHSKQTVESKITELFQRKQYPAFELGEFYAHPLFSSHDKFHFFIDILEEWNRKIQKAEIPAFSQALFKKNTFIFDTLKNATLQAPALADHVLTNLYLWFNGTRNTTLKMAHTRKQETKPTDQQWQIRNTFKSNLPAEIGMYRRRVFWDYNKEKCMSAKFIEPSRKVRTEAEEMEARNEVEDKRMAKIENALVRAEMERKEFLSVQNKWKMKKYRQSQSGAKNYFGGAFNNGKTYFPKKNTQSKKKETDMVTLKRVHTSLGYRSVTKKAPQLYNRFSENDATLLISPKVFTQQRQPSFEQFDGNKQNQILHQVGAIDGLHLLANPFEKKLKKKKRRS